MNSILFIGHTVRDIVGHLADDLRIEPDQPVSVQRLDDIVTGFGGKAANAAVNCAGNGGESVFVGTVGCDFEQLGYGDHLRSRAVNPQHAFHLEGQTPVFMALNSPNKIHILHRPYPFSDEENHRFLDHIKAVIQRQPARMVYLALWNLALAVEILDYAKSVGLQTAWNPLFQTAGQPSAIQDLNHTDFLFVNEAEATILESHLGLAVSEFHKVYGVSVVCVTLGEHGCRLADHGESIVIPAHSVPAIVDPTGAGDAFAGAFLAHAVSPDFTAFSRCVEAANRAAAAVVAQLGTQGPAPD